mmetsp:Transcript_84435/g.217456  ORF Transcript_84435/g.217456 Transcript_84435/m.217456 type:complete len:282 (+) Transcript_84435:486-1331(+)
MRHVITVLGAEARHLPTGHVPQLVCGPVALQGQRAAKQLFRHGQPCWEVPRVRTALDSRRTARFSPSLLVRRRPCPRPDAPHARPVGLSATNGASGRKSARLLNHDAATAHRTSIGNRGEDLVQDQLRLTRGIRGWQMPCAWFQGFQGVPLLGHGTQVLTVPLRSARGVLFADGHVLGHAMLTEELIKTAVPAELHHFKVDRPPRVHAGRLHKADVDPKASMQTGSLDANVDPMRHGCPLGVLRSAVAASGVRDVLPLKSEKLGRHGVHHHAARWGCPPSA